LLEILEVDH
jgi:hypothetical protein